ncbi:formate-dependent nitrite reductase, periplasmic cytochrome c552 subunit [Desulfitobacterium dichloroeliminans LMG P-21439]|uniref:nitrite reductase (cytochrome; ammonia-forming) n=1 Tax=Desulfitobacterium dichloroeliminans (strain LMG P-21439 / DCA1) TaxID=871963 RepID=L0F770_DESDL|nr:ammonia-forming cytochrome c nitrite reductase subunit c552 [Desulfitobacterium dichloroeliminans]AGA69012.1 formate-dependent nitrite reductase, periplasmic cytochrome c552 subunit [Desulfitobacterium dichloroeliminans LMG P-21439]
MEKRSLSGKALGVIIFLIVVLVGSIATVIYIFDSNNQKLKTEQVGQIAADEVDPAVWGQYYPVHYQTYLQNGENTDMPSHFETKPYMKLLYAGLGYSNEFNEPRGHVYTLEDIRAVDSSRYKVGASCNTCKSTQIPGLIEKYGADYYTSSFEEINSQLEYPIGCLDCHNPETMELRISRPALIEAFERQGKDITQATRQEMRSLVCAQCHVTYYFEPDTKKVMFPWDKGVKADQILDYYDEKKFSEWKHPDADTGLVKARHAEYEVFQGSTHESAGLACADCHMPYMKMGNTKVSSHYWTSPLKNIEESCGVCHREGAEWLESRVDDIQAKTKEIQDIAGETMVQAVEEIALARQTPGVNADLLAQAQQMHRDGQWYLDYVMVTNGYGFHNPMESMNNLGKAIDFAHQAIQLAKDAAIKSQ